MQNTERHHRSPLPLAVTARLCKRALISVSTKLAPSWSVGLPEYGLQLLKRFKWGEGFYRLNQEVLDIYAACQDGAGVVKAQEAWMDKLETEDLLRTQEGKAYLLLTSGPCFRSHYNH